MIKHAKHTDTKVIISGSTLEVYEYLERPLFYGFVVPEKLRKARTRIRVVDEASRLRKIESRKNSMRRAQSTLRRLINTNACKWKKPNGKPYLPIFVTFTFAENIQDTKIANKLFSRFIKSFNYALTHEKKSFLKYVVVTEFQKRGAIHYHIIFFNLPYIKDIKKIFEASWEHGFVRIKGIDHVKNVGAYICKYMSKEFGDERLDGKKRYFTSRKLNKPVGILNQSHARNISSKLPKELIVAQKEYLNYKGEKTRYTQFQIEKDKSFSDVVPELEHFL